MWQTLILAFGLMLVFEGLLPALNPRGYRRALQMLGEMPDRQLRGMGLLLLGTGAGLIFLFSH